MNNSMIINGEMCFPYIYNENYFVSRTGKIYSIYVIGGQGSVDLTRPHLLSYGVDKDGYYRVVLSVHGMKKYIRVHTVIVQQFIGNIPEGLVVNHIDGNKKNNCVENLEITTVLENTIHAHHNGLCSVDCRVTVIYGNEIYNFSSKAECARHLPLTLDYLNKIQKNIVLYSMILFELSEAGGVDAYYNGIFYMHFNQMIDADDYFNVCRGTTSSAVKRSSVVGSYKEVVNRYRVIFS